MKSVIAFCLALVFSGVSFAAQASDLQGSWRGERYSFDLNDSWDEIRGEWGSRRYDLDVSSTWNEVRGTLADGSVNLRISSSFGDASGNLPCGSVRLSYSKTFREITGTLCGSRVKIDIRREDDVPDAFADLISEAVADYFPAPAQSPVKRFILRRLRF